MADEPAPSPETVARLFQSALAAMRHPPSCFCGGGFRPVLSAAALEADLLDYLGPLYAGRGEAALAAAIGSHQERGDSFTDWLRALPHSGLDGRQQALLLVDLAALLASAIEAAPPSGRLVCG